MRAILFLLVLVAPAASDPTTPGFLTIIEGRCWGWWAMIRRANINLVRPPNQDCAGITAAFVKVYNSTPNLQPNKTELVPFWQLAGHSIPADRSLFWSGTSGISLPGSVAGRGIPSLGYDLVHDLSFNRFRFWTLEDTLWGFMFNGLNFCKANRTLPGSVTFPFDNVTQCVYTAHSISYWQAASSWFAGEANGRVEMLTSAPPGTKIYRAAGNYPNDIHNRPVFPTIFAEIELPNLNSRVTNFTINIWNATSPENCEQAKKGVGSIAWMIGNLTRQLPSLVLGSTINCIDSDHPQQVAMMAEYLVCVTDLWNCRFPLQAQPLPESSHQVPWGLNGTVFGLATGVLGFAVGTILCCVQFCLRKRTQKRNAGDYARLNG